MTVCFIGHRKITGEEALKNALIKTVTELIENGADTFLLGSRSDFNSICLDVVTELKICYPHIKRVYVRSAYPYIEKYYEDYLLESFDETYFPAQIEGAGRASYVERNQEMINKSDICVFYYDKEYKLPPKRQKSRMPLPDIHVNSGTKIAYEYAVSKKKKIINLFI